jgi:hypothetical protein
MWNILSANIAYASEAGTLIGNIKTKIIEPIISLLFVLATIVFIWGVAEMIRGADSEEARTTGKQHIIYGLVGLFIMISAGWMLTALCDFMGAGIACDK